jgi:presenilin-like A22 family membrane protease
MKHSLKITFILLAMFFVAQLIGIYVSSVYQPQITQEYNSTTQQFVNTTSYNIPYGFEPPQDISPQSSVTSIVLALIIAVLLMLLLMRLRAEVFLRWWFFIVVIIGIAIALNAFLISVQYSAIIAAFIALVLAYLKVFKRNLIAHNFTELLIYAGIASLFIPLLNVGTTVVLLVIISIYDMYAVWHSGFMQKMAKYQMEKVRVFSGFFIPYISGKDRLKLKKMRAMQKNKKGKKIKVPVHLAILGGGDVVFPLILAGVVLAAFGPLAAIIIAIGAALGLASLFYFSQKGKFYPAMPFITIGAFIALGIVYLIA